MSATRRWNARTRLAAVAMIVVSSVSATALAEDEADALPADPTALFESATKALADGRPLDAIERLEALGDRGVVDAAVSYDRGLAYATRVRAGTGAEQPGDLGRAAHGFEEARELTTDARLRADALSALAEVRAEVARRRARDGDPVEIDSGIPVGRAIVRLLPENVWAIGAALAALATSIGVVLRARSERRRLQVAGATTAAIGAALLALCAVVVYAARDARRNLHEAVVVSPSARLLDDKRLARPGPALPEGARLRVVEELGELTRVATGSAEGLVASSALRPLAKP